MSNSLNLKVGIEQEHFVFHKSGRPPNLLETANFFKSLHALGYSPRPGHGTNEGLNANLDFSDGYISIKNDFCTHLVEVAFPPTNEPEKLLQLYEKTWAQIKASLKSLDLLIHYGAVIDPVPAEDLVLVPHPRSDWMPNRPSPENKTGLYHRYFNTLMAATQVHLNIWDEDSFRVLPQLYKLDYLTSLVFSNSKNFSNTAYHCVRPLIWRDNFSPKYWAFAIPEPIPTSIYEYQNRIAQCPDFQKDYTFISPRKHQTFEFRSGCSQNTGQDVLTLSALRIGVAQACLLGQPITGCTANEFYKVCRDGTVSNTTIKNDLKVLESVFSDMSPKWSDHISRCLTKIYEATNSKTSF